MFDSQSMQDYTDEQRELMVRATELQLEIAKAQVKVLPVRLEVLQNPTQDAEEALSLISSAELSSLRREYAEVVIKLLKSAVDLPGLKMLLPMLTMAVSSKVNVPLILRAFNIDDNQVAELMQLLKSYTSL